ncbi:MAG: hypothetical protein CNC06_03310 [Pelagibacterales bacterium MED-G40]|nr:MAG: hypothetical protein CNC06_03310 [Pelagibacterales bacterium MED-G40]|tara:strand:+ start:81 stop:233 length:153 start_codon:yes stop_codon:yes gene_type:complete
MINFLKEFLVFLRYRKKWWLYPIFLILGIFGFLIIMSQGSTVAPFIYAIF